MLYQLSYGRPLPQSGPATGLSVRSGRPSIQPLSGQGQNRTADTMIFSHVLYQLSYLAKVIQPLSQRARSALPARPVAKSAKATEVTAAH